MIYSFCLIYLLRPKSTEDLCFEKIPNLEFHGPAGFFLIKTSVLKQNYGVETFGILTKILFKCENTFQMRPCFLPSTTTHRKIRIFKENSWTLCFQRVKKTKPKCEREVKGRFRNLCFYCVYKCRKSEGCKGEKGFNEAKRKQVSTNEGFLPEDWPCASLGFKMSPYDALKLENVQFRSLWWLPEVCSQPNVTPILLCLQAQSPN